MLRLFEDHGPPLFFKRDNRSNLNHHELGALLSAQLVIPVNSPRQYPPYNGGIEKAQREVKDSLCEHSDQPKAFLAIQAELDVQTLNHRRGLIIRWPPQGPFPVDVRARRLKRDFLSMEVPGESYCSVAHLVLPYEVDGRSAGMPCRGGWAAIRMDGGQPPGALDCREAARGRGP